MISRANARRLIDDYQLYSSPQFSLSRTGDKWSVSEVTGTVNPTLLNGEVLRNEKLLQPGDRIAVRNTAATGATVGGELTVSFLPACL
jgi:hypothetical protein